MCSSYLFLGIIRWQFRIQINRNVELRIEYLYKFLQRYQLKSATTKIWLIAVGTELHLKFHIKLFYDLLMERKTDLYRFIYQLKSNIYYDTTIEIELYQESFLQCIEIDWKKGFECIHKFMCYTKLRFYMFKFFHRKLVNNHLMFKWKLMETSMCVFVKKKLKP